MKEIKMSFGNNLKLLRKEKGLTQEQLAEMLRCRFCVLNN